MEQIIFLTAQYGYFFVFLLAVAEGPLVSLVVGFLVYLGYLSFLPAFLMLMLGDIIPDTIYYYIGRFGSEKKIIEKYKTRTNLFANNFKLVEKLWQDHPRKTMFLGKLAYGLSIPFLLSAGLVKMPYGRFIAYAVPVTIFQYGIIMTLGYILGHSYQVAIRYIKYSGFIMFFVVILFIAGYIFLSKYAGREIKKG